MRSCVVQDGGSGEDITQGDVSWGHRAGKKTNGFSACLLGFRTASTSSKVLRTYGRITIRLR